MFVQKDHTSINHYTNGQGITLRSALPKEHDPSVVIKCGMCTPHAGEYVDCWKQEMGGKHMFPVSPITGISGKELGN